MTAWDRSWVKRATEMDWKELNMKGELVTFRASDGAALVGFLSRPKGTSKTAIIHLHGLNGTFYKPLSIKLGKKLVNKGFTYMSIQQRGSYNEVVLSVYKKSSKRTRLIAGGCFEKFEDCIFDIEGAIKYLKGIGIKRIYLQGHSTGCQKSVYYEIKKNDKAVKGIILLAPADDYNIWKDGTHTLLGKNRRDEFPRMVAFAKSKLRSDPFAPMSQRYDGVRYSARRFLSFADLGNVEARIFNYDMPRLKEFGTVKVPIFAVFGTDDEYLAKPARECMRILGKNSGSSEFVGVIMKGANHGFFGDEDKLAGLIVKWVDAQEK